MGDATIAEKLRDMAEHRGLKLVKSRRRKPGTGDYGKFGLTDAAGKALLGIDEEGLTASADEVEEYLRAGAVNTWKASAEATPATPERPAPVAKAKDAEEAHKPPPKTGANSRQDRSVRRRSDGERKTGAAIEPKAGKERQAEERLAVPDDARVVRRVNAKPAAKQVPEPELAIRPAKSGDSAALTRLLDQSAHIKVDELAIARNHAAVQKASGGMVVAELGALVGCCTWAVVPTVQHGALGRITMLLVDTNHRRRGIGSAMLEAATGALRTAGCTKVEVMSDIEIAHSHGFFRALEFEQTSYRFSREIGDAPNRPGRPQA